LQSEHLLIHIRYLYCDYIRDIMTVKRFLTLLSFLVALSSTSVAQLPATDLFMIHYSNVDTQFNLKKVSYLSAFNPLGYNNQPQFIGLDELYISSDVYSVGKPEIIKLDLYSQTLERITKSEESDFSPSPLPDGTGLSTVRIEQDGVTQSLWAYDDRSFSTGARILADVSTVGYYKWLSEEDIAMFLLPEPFTLSIANISTGQTRTVIDNIGRCLRQDEEGKLIFTHTISGGITYIKSYDIENNKMEVVCQALEGSQDFEMIGGGAFVMAKGSKLFYFDPDLSTSWTEVLDLADLGITNISRLAYSRGRLVLVNTK